ncbi:MAG: hypothetical protein WCT16_01170 [Candidatus Buchananbacteria bacterium]
MKKILFIDVDEDYRMSVARALHEANYDVQAINITSKTGLEQAKEKLLKGEFAVIIIEPETPMDDLKKGLDALPGMRILAAWREQGIALPPIIAFTWRHYSNFFCDKCLYDRGFGCVVDKIGDTDSLLAALECLWETQEEAENTPE